MVVSGRLGNLSFSYKRGYNNAYFAAAVLFVSALYNVRVIGFVVSKLLSPNLYIRLVFSIEELAVCTVFMRDLVVCKWKGMC